VLALLGQPSKLLQDELLAYGERLFAGFSNGELAGHTACGDGGHAPTGKKPGIDDPVTFDLNPTSCLLKNNYMILVC